MAKNIALTLTINGVKQNIQNINQLEKAIKQAEDELKNIEIGSAQFKQLTTEVKTAKGVFEDFQESVKGLELEKRVGGFAKLGEGITASFAGAQAAISLFGNESEAVAEASAKAQSVLTIALAARSAAEGVVQVRTVAANIATIASAAAANAATIATRTLYATLAANPYGAILALIGLVVAAFIQLAQTQKEQVDIQKELASVQSDEAEALKNSLFILTRFNNQRELQRQELEKLKKEYPGFNAFINEENQLTKDGIAFLKLKIKQYELEAQAKLIVQKIAENALKIQQIEAENLTDSISLYDAFFTALANGGRLTESSQALVNQALQRQRERIQEVTEENDRWRESLTQIYIQTDEVLRQLKPYNQQLETQVDINKRLETTTTEIERRQQQLADAYKKGRNEIISFKSEIDKLTEAFKIYDQTIKNLEQTNISGKIVSDLEKIQQARAEGAKQFRTAIENLKTSVKELTDISQEDFLQIFREFRTELEIAFTKPEESIDKFRKIYERFVSENGNLTQENIKTLFDFSRGYEDFARLIESTPGFKDAINQLNDLRGAFADNINNVNEGYGSWNNFLQILGDVAAATGAYKLEIDDLTGKIEEFKFDPFAVQKNSQEAFRIIRENLVRPLTLELLTQRQKNLQALSLTLTRPEQEIEKRQVEGRLQTIRDAIEQFKKGGTLAAGIIDPKEIETAINLTLEQFNKLLNGITVAEDKILRVNLQVEQLTKNLQGNTQELSDALANVLISNVNTITEVISGIRTQEQKDNERFIAKAKKDVVDFEFFKDQLVEKGLINREQLGQISRDNLLKLYAEYLKKEESLLKESEKRKQEERKKTYQDLQRGFELFSTTLNQTSALFQERVRADLEALRVQEQITLRAVVGDTESANKKRLEIQEEYQRAAKELEKQGRITALRFSLVQTIANGAQAFVRALADLGPVLGPILAGVNAALTLGQVVIIQDQIATAQALRRGGLLKAQGGMLLRGPSHEQGGIPLAQMGVIAEGNEAIINRQSSMNYMGLLSSINQSGGGKPLVVNNFDDSRIVEALAKQKQTPIRAYVLGSDITNEQQISKRLDELSKF